jgi:hypothetical protein
MSDWARPTAMIRSSFSSGQRMPGDAVLPDGARDIEFVSWPPPAYRMPRRGHHGDDRVYRSEADQAKDNRGALSSGVERVS